MYGMLGHVGLARESTWGTPVAITDYVEALSETLAATYDRFETRNIVGRLSEPDDSAGVLRIEGDLVIPGHPVAIGHLLNGAFGQGSRTVTTVLSGFLWTTEWWPTPADAGANNPLPPYTLEIFRDVTSAHRYAGVQVSKLTLQVQPNQELRVTAGLLAKTTSVVAKTTPTFPGSPTDPFTFDTASVQVGGAAVDIVETLTLDLDNQLEGIPVLNVSNEIARVRRSGPQLVRASGTLAFETLTDYNRFIGQTEQGLVLTMTKAQSFAMLLELPRLVYTAFPTGMAGRERNMVEFEATGRYHAGSGHALRARLTTVKSNWGA
jgi:hypothetical protein